MDRQRLMTAIGVVAVTGTVACGGDGKSGSAAAPAATPPTTSERKYLLERIGEAAVAQVYADGFSTLPLKERTLIWHLYQAALAGRDIFYDQRYAHNLEMRDVLEAIVSRRDAIDPATRDEILRRMASMTNA